MFLVILRVKKFVGTFYEKKSDLKSATGIDTSDFANKKADLAGIKSSFLTISRLLILVIWLKN